MFKTKRMQIFAMIIMSILLITGCGKKEDSITSDKVDGEAGVETQAEEPQETDEKETEMETEKTEELQEVSGPVTYTGTEMPIEIILPGNEWESNVDSRDYSDFVSDKGVINIMYMAGEGVGAMQVPDSKEAYESNIRGIFAELEFQVLSFENYQEGDRNCYYAVIQYAEDNPDKYLVAHGSFTNDEGYTVAATLEVEDQETLEALEACVKSFKIVS